MKKLRYLAEAALLWTAFFVFRLMGPDKASACGGWIGRTIGPRLGASRKALTNLKSALPHLGEEEHNRIVRGMWDNLGRVMAEYPHLQTIIARHVEVVGEEHIINLVKGAPLVIIGGHLANWELLPFYFNHRLDLPMTGLYREPNNPYTAKILDKSRNPEVKGRYVPKSSQGVRDMVRTLQSGGRLGLLIDQKYNQGLAADFFGRPAMTSPAFAQLAAKFDCPILPFRVERVKGCRFRVTSYPTITATGRDEADVVREAHEILERWISERPGQWLWLHRRWDSRALRDNNM